MQCLHRQTHLFFQTFVMSCHAAFVYMHTYMHALLLFNSWPTFSAFILLCEVYIHAYIHTCIHPLTSSFSAFILLCEVCIDMSVNCESSLTLSFSFLFSFSRDVIMSSLAANSRRSCSISPDWPYVCVYIYIYIYDIYIYIYIYMLRTHAWDNHGVFIYACMYVYLHIQKQLLCTLWFIMYVHVYFMYVYVHTTLYFICQRKTCEQNGP